MAKHDDFAKGLCTFLNALRHPTGCFYRLDGKEVQVSHVRPLASNRLLVTMSDGSLIALAAEMYGGNR
jgi:hypothetical protein